MNVEYVKALGVREEWTKHTEREWAGKNLSRKEIPEHGSSINDIIPAYYKTLTMGEVYFMNKKFCSLVDHARLSVPDDLRFDLTWMQSRIGWLYLEEPFLTPQFELNEEMGHIVDEEIEKIRRTDPDRSERLRVNREGKFRNVDIPIRAIGWMPVGKITELPDGRRYGNFTGNIDEDGGTAFLCFMEMDDKSYGYWSYFTVQNNETVIDKIKMFESTALKDGGAYPQNRAMEQTHEIRWVYTAMHLMAQRLAITVHHDPDRAVRRRAERENKSAPPSLKVVSLRKFEEDKQKAEASGDHKHIEYNWQWTVRGHWRNQFYPGTKEYKQIFIEAFIKGPEGKPMKAPQQTFFVAKR